ncbi:helix-turn-helix domain-containing protein [Rhodopseudomonas sp.]|uniref:helix-turn-helix domain-containing protein n=1 Tax=Rhodopseudomonas sp. TaxID=1078 RepID=UPI0039E600CC
MPVMTKTPAGEDIVILARKEYDELVAAANEDAADAAAARRIMARVESGAEQTLTADELDELLASKTPLAFYRKRAGLTQAALAKSAGIAQGFLSEIEAGRKTGDIHTLRRIADALGISLDDLVAAEAPAESTPKRRAARSR